MNIMRKTKGKDLKLHHANLQKRNAIQKLRQREEKKEDFELNATHLSELYQKLFTFYIRYVPKIDKMQ